MWQKIIAFLKRIFSEEKKIDKPPDGVIEVCEHPGIKFEKPTFDVTHIIIHHSDTKDSGSISWDAITKYHIEHNGWDDNGYNWGCELVGDHYKIFRGRSMTRTGAHCRDGRFNSRSIGICVVGDWDKEEPPQPQLFMVASLVRDLQRFLGIKAENVIGHREAQQQAGVMRKNRKTCPGKLFDMDKFRSMLLP